MKGIVFTELFEMIEHLFGEDMLDNILDDCELETGGAYTTVGTYDYKELIEIVRVLSLHTDIPFRELVKTYGRHLFFRFHEKMPEFFEEPKNSFEFLESVHSHIHVEVKKLYPDAVLPHFDTKRNTDDVLTMIYMSHCPLADFAEGLIAGCIEFYKENIKIESTDYNTGTSFSRVFILTKH